MGDKPEGKIRVRSQNFTKEDTALLIQLAEENKNILENKSTDGGTSSYKDKTWKKICDIFNPHTTLPRTPEILRRKYDSLKRDARKYAAEKQQKIWKKTGGGPPERIKEDPLLEKVVELIKLSAEGHKSTYDSDAVYDNSGLQNELRGNNAEDRGNLHDKYPSDEVGFDRYDNAEYCCNVIGEEGVSSDAGGALTVIYSQPVVSQSNEQEQDDDDDDDDDDDGGGGGGGGGGDDEEGEYALNWGKYNPKMLRTPKHFVIKKVLYNSSDQEQIPGMSSQGNSTSAHNNSAEFNKTKRRRYQSKSISFSATAQKLEPWVASRTQFEKMKVQFLQERHLAEQRREEELFLLKKRDLELSIQIKEETLRGMRLISA